MGKRLATIPPIELLFGDRNQRSAMSSGGSRPRTSFDRELEVLGP